MSRCIRSFSRPPHESSAIPFADGVDMARRRTSLEIVVALGATLMGLGAIAAASLGEAGLRLPGFALLLVGAVTTSTFRLRREQERLDQSAVDDLEVARMRLAQG